MKYDCLNPAVYSYVKSKRNDIVFYDLYHESEYSFHKWREEIGGYDIEHSIDLINKRFKNKNVYLLCSEKESRFEEVYQNKDVYSIQFESYILYKLVN